MANETDIAWLAGIVDGEGCFAVKRPIKRKSGKRQGSTTSYQLWLVLCNTSQAMVIRASRILTEIGVQHQPIRRVWKGDKATRWQYWLQLARKHDLLKATEALLPYLTAKKTEAEIVVWYLRRACQVEQHKMTAVEAAIIDSMAVIKRCGGEAPAEIERMLREVIPNQAVSGRRQADDGETEGVETRSVSPNNNPTHECPTSEQVH